MKSFIHRPITVPVRVKAYVQVIAHPQYSEDFAVCFFYNLMFLLKPIPTFTHGPIVKTNPYFYT